MDSSYLMLVYFTGKRHPFKESVSHKNNSMIKSCIKDPSTKKNNRVKFKDSWYCLNIRIWI